MKSAKSKKPGLINTAGKGVNVKLVQYPQDTEQTSSVTEIQNNLKN